MSRGRGESPRGSGEGVSDALLDALLDGSLKGEERARALRALSARPGLAREYACLRGLLAQMDHDVAQAPDLSGPILAEVGRRRGFLGCQLRRIGLVAQVAAGVTLLGAIGAIALVQHSRPELVVPRSASPMTMVVDAAQEDLGGSVRELMGQTRQVVREDLGEPADRLGRRLVRSGDASFIMAGLGMVRRHAEQEVRWEVDASSSTMSGGAGDVSAGVFVSTFAFEDAGPSIGVPTMVGGGERGVWVMGQRARVVRLDPVSPLVRPVVGRASEFRLESVRDEP